MGHRVADDGRKRRQRERRERRVDPLNGLPHRAGQCGGFARRARHDPHAAERILIERHVHRRRRGLLEAGVAHAADDADDFVETVGAIADVDRLSNRVVVWKVTVDELLIDKRHLRRLLAVRSVKARPRSSGIPIAWKYSGLTTR